MSSSQANSPKRTGMFPYIGRVEGHSFLQGSLNAESVVVDLGINQANFARNIHALTGCRVLGVEAVPDLAAKAPVHDWLQVVNVAIAGADGTVTMHLNQTGDATLRPDMSEDDVTTVEVRGTTLESFLSAHEVGTVDLLKVDIEGAEFALFDSAPDALLQRLVQITIEFHDFKNAALTPDVDRVKARMRALDFICLTFSGNNTDVLFVNRRYLHVGAVARAYMLALYKYGRGIGRQIAGRL
ncbi:MAG: FkbM family methyltransferase [Alphaproteobacteria bacterium]